MRDDSRIKNIKYLAKQKRYAKAIEELDNYLYENSTDYYMMVYKAMLLAKSLKIKEARELLDYTLTLPIDLRTELFLYNQYAYIEQYLENIDESIKYLELLISKSDNLEVICREKLAYLYIEKDEYEKAFDILNIEGFNHKLFNIARAQINVNLGYYKKALSCLKEPEENRFEYFVGANITNELVMEKENLMYGRIYINSGQYEPALKHLNQVLKSKDKRSYWVAYYRIALCHFDMNNNDECIKICKNILDKCPNVSINESSNILLGRAYLRKDDFKNASIVANSIKNTNMRIYILAKIKLVQFDLEGAAKLLTNCDHSDSINYMRLMMLKLEILYRLDDYENFMVLYNELVDKNNDLDFTDFSLTMERMKLFLETKRDLPTSASNSYTNSQICNYSKESAIKHVNERHVIGTHFSRFSNDINIENIFNNIELYLKDANKYAEGVFDRYVIKYPNIGYNQYGSKVHYMTILCLMNTYNITTMFPADRIDGVDFIQDQNRTEKKIIKHLSPIEKFNKRYGNGY